MLQFYYERTGVNFLPAFGQVIELRGLTGSFGPRFAAGEGALPASELLRGVLATLTLKDDPALQASELAAGLKQEEEELRLMRFADEEAGKNYPYLFSLVSVRLWAMAEASAREVLVEGITQGVGVADQMEAVVLAEVIPAWARDKRTEAK